MSTLRLSYLSFLATVMLAFIASIVFDFPFTWYIVTGAAIGSYFTMWWLAGYPASAGTGIGVMLLTLHLITGESVSGWDIVIAFGAGHFVMFIMSWLGEALEVG